MHRHAIKAYQPACLWVDLPITPYRQALALQQKLVAARVSGQLTKDVVLVLEHPPVFTLGRRGGSENLMISDAQLHQAGIEMVQCERGGNITYHGPGQLVVYPIINLRAANLSVHRYVDGLEEVMIRTAAHWGIQAHGDPENRGVWLGLNKLGSLGICIRHGVCFHGLALNVQPDLKPFTWINPCGLQDIDIVSMESVLCHKILMADVRRVFKSRFTETFDVQPVAAAVEELTGL